MSEVDALRAAIDAIAEPTLHDRAVSAQVKENFLAAVRALQNSAFTPPVVQPCNFGLDPSEDGFRDPVFCDAVNVLPGLNLTDMVESGSPDKAEIILSRETGASSSLRIVVSFAQVEKDDVAPKSSFDPNKFFQLIDQSKDHPITITVEDNSGSVPGPVHTVKITDELNQHQ